MKNKDLRQLLEQIDNKTLYANLIFSQLILLLIGLGLYIFFLRQEFSFIELFHTDRVALFVLVGLCFAVVVVVFDLIIMRIAPHYFDDGGVNERIFGPLNVWQSALVAFCVSVIEEFVFRAVIQEIFGLILASILFAVIHFRYLHRWGFIVIVLCLSFGFGILYEWTNSIWTVISAHFFIDFILGLVIRSKQYKLKKW